MKKQIIFFLIFCLIGGIGVKEIREMKRERERYKIEQLPPTNFENIVPADLFAEMSKSGRKVVDGVLDAIEVDRSGPSFVYFAEEPFDFYEVLSFLRLYFGNFDEVDKLMFSTGLEVHIDMNVARKLEKERKEIMGEIEKEIKKFRGNEEEILVKQASSFLLNSLSYKRGEGNGIEGIEEGKGNCNSYSTLFRLMLSRLGIECDVCVGFTARKEYHAWNRVKFSDGEYKYYDLTLEDRAIFRAYLGNTNSYHKVAGVNYYLTNEEIKSFVEKNF